MEPEKAPRRAVVEHQHSVHLAEFANLSQREAQVLSYAAAGYIDKQIGQELGVSVNTLRTYWQRIRSKIGEAPRSALAAGYVTHIAQNASGNTEQFTPDWEIDFANDRFVFLTDRPHPQRYLDGKPLEEVVRTYVPEDQPGLRRLIAQLRSGELDAVYLTGRFNTPHGEDKASAYIQVVHDGSGHPIKLAGRRVPLVELSARSEQPFDWELDLQTNMVRRLSETWLPHTVDVGAEIPLEQVIQNYHPEDQPKLRALMVSARRGELDTFTFAGRAVTATGVVPTGAYVETTKDENGRPLKLLGRRSLSFSLGGEGGVVISVGSLSRNFDTDHLVADNQLREIFHIGDSDADLVNAMASRVVPEQAAAFRNTMRQVLQAKVDKAGVTYRLIGDQDAAVWVRFEFNLTIFNGRPQAIIGKVIAFR